MFSPKLLSLLQAFNRYELNRLRKFLLSPYFNEQEQIVELFDCCNQAIRQGPEAVADLDKKSVWKTICPGEKLDEAHLRRLSSELTRLALKFMATEYREQYPVSEWIELQHRLEKPDLHKHLSSVERQLDKYFLETTVHPADYYLHRFNYRWQIFKRASRVLSTTDYLRKLKSADYALEVFYLVQKLKLFVAWRSYQNVRATEETILLPSDFEEYFTREPFATLPIIRVYRWVVACLTEPEQEAHFQQLVRTLEQSGESLAEEDLRECYHHAQNYCALKINQGKTEYYREVFQIFTQMMARAVLLEDGQLSEGVFKNIITVGLRIGEFRWVEQFIQEYADFLPLNIRENARSYNLANLYSHQKQYGKVIELLASVEYSDVTYTLGAKLILLRTYFEAGEDLALESLIESFRIYLRRNQIISKSIYREYSNFLNALRKLNNLQGATPAEIETFRKKVADNPALISKKWLLEKLDEL